jgi:hypothetical protein
VRDAHAKEMAEKAAVAAEAQRKTDLDAALAASFNAAMGGGGDDDDDDDDMNMMAWGDEVVVID